MTRETPTLQFYQRKDSGSFYLPFRRGGKRLRLWVRKDKATLLFLLFAPPSAGFFIGEREEALHWLREPPHGLPPASNAIRKAPALFVAVTQESLRLFIGRIARTQIPQLPSEFRDYFIPSHFADD